MPKPSNNSVGEQLNWKGELERSRVRNLKHQENVGAPLQPMNARRPQPADSRVGESNWGRQLERNRLRNATLYGGTALPGPGAAAAAKAPAIGKPLQPNLTGGDEKPGGGKAGGVKAALADPRAPSSVETAKVAAQIASGVGMGKLAAEEAKKAVMAAGKGGLAAAGAIWQIINKYGPWALFFAFFTIICEDPFITAPLILLVLWIWLVAAHWLKISFIRKFNVLEILALIVCSAVYVAIFAMIVLLLSLIACALDSSCAAEAISSFGIGSAMEALGL